MKPDSCNSYSSSQQSSYNNGSSSCGNNRIRVIRLRRRSNVPLGFSVRGGREHGTGIFVSEVKAGSEAHHQGLLVGDQILRINGFNIEHAIHDEVLALLRAKPGVVIKVKSMGMIPVKDTKKDPLTWKIVDPGPSPEYNGKSNPNSIGAEGIETRLSIPAIGASGLGCSIVKGPPDIPGIYVQSVKSGSLAEKAGLQVGDRIMEMNGHNFTNLDFPDAVAVLKSSKQMSLVLCKGVGLDLFPEEKQRRIAEAHTTVKHGEIAKLSSVPEEEPRDDRDAKKTNGHIYRVKNGTEHKHPNEGEIKRNGNSSCSESDVSCHQFNQADINQTKLNHCVKVRATVHSSSGDEESVRQVRNCARELGDGMDSEYMNSNRNVPNTNGQSWNSGKRNFNDGQIKAKTQSIIQIETDTFSEDEYCSSSLTQEKEIFKENGSSRHTQFLSEIQLHGDKSSVTSDEKSELSSLSSDDYLGVPKISTRGEGSKPPNEFLKRKQHELLMEEFREVHKKMFGQGPPRLTKPPKQMNGDGQDPSGQYRRRQQIRKDKVAPPPPPPPDIDGQFINSESFNRVESIEDLCNTDDKHPLRKRQREPPITDSRDPEPKPPQTYFDNGPKPLVTIGTYSNNNQQNRFLNNDITNIKTKQHHFETKVPFSSKIKGELTFTVHQNPCSSSSSSTVPSSSSSEPRSPTSESVVSSDSLFNSSSTSISKGSKLTDDESQRNVIETVPNSFQISLSQFSKNEAKTLDNMKVENLKNLTNSRTNKTSNNKMGQTIKKEKTDLQKEILEMEAEGRETKTLILKKNGPLNFRVEGGINADSSGRILVSEVWAGSCSTEGGKIELGDQILMVDDTKLTGLSLTAANVALRNANSNSNKEMRLVIAKPTKELRSLEI